MIFDERIENAKRILTQNQLSEQHPVADAAYVIRYLRYIGESEEKILKIIDRMFAQKYYVPSRPDMSKYYKPAYVMAKRLPPVRTDGITLTMAQINKIHAICDLDAEHFVFASLCIYLYYHNSDDLYTVKLNDALKIAGVSNIKKIAGFVRTTSLVSLKQFHNVHYVEISPELLQIDDKLRIPLDNFINLCYYYDKLIGNGRFTRCARCWCIVKQPERGRPKLYCKTCARRVDFEKRSIRKRRSEKRNDKKAQ